MHGVNGDKHAISIVLIIAYKTTVTVNKNSNFLFKADVGLICASSSQTHESLKESRSTW
jgi:hypothetical protein